MRRVLGLHAIAAAFVASNCGSSHDASKDGGVVLSDAGDPDPAFSRAQWAALQELSPAVLPSAPPDDPPSGFSLYLGNVAGLEALVRLPEAALLTHLQLLNAQYNLAPFPKKLSFAADRAEV